MDKLNQSALKPVMLNYANHPAGKLFDLENPDFLFKIIKILKEFLDFQILPNKFEFWDTF